MSFACQLSGTLSWELCPTQGRQPKALGHTTAVVGDTLYIFGGIYRGNATNVLYMLNTGTNNKVRYYMVCKSTMTLFIMVNIILCNLTTSSIDIP